MKKKINWNKEIIKEKVSKILTIIWRVLLIIILGFIFVGYLYQCSNNAKKLDHVTTNNELINRYDRHNYQVNDNEQYTYTSNGFLILYTNEGIISDGVIVESSSDVKSADGGYFEYSYNIIPFSDYFVLHLETNFYYLNDVYPFGYYNNNSPVFVNYMDTPFISNYYSWTFNYDLRNITLIKLNFDVFNYIEPYYIIRCNITPYLYNNDEIVYASNDFMENIINTSVSLNRNHFSANSLHSLLDFIIPSDFNISTRLFASNIDSVYDDGYDDGYDVGYRDGSNDSGLAENGFITMFNIILTAPFNIFNGLLNFELFGVNLFNVFSFVITAFIIIWVVRKFL